MKRVDIQRLIWDDWNVTHIAKHGVVPQEVEEVCQGNHHDYESYDGRFLVIGITETARMLLVVLDPEPEEGVYYPVTARSASRKERKYYQQEQGGEAA